MKNIVKLVGIIALVAVIGFGFVSCGDDDDGGGNNNNNNNSNQPINLPQTVTFTVTPGYTSTSQPPTFSIGFDAYTTMAISSYDAQPSSGQTVTFTTSLSSPNDTVTLTSNEYGYAGKVITVTDTTPVTVTATTTTGGLAWSSRESLLYLSVDGKISEWAKVNYAID